MTRARSGAKSASMSVVQQSNQALRTVQNMGSPSKVAMMMKIGKTVDQLQRSGVKDVAREVICAHGANTNNAGTLIHTNLTSLPTRILDIVLHFYP